MLLPSASRDSFIHVFADQFAFSRRPHGAGIHNGDVPVEQKEIETWRELRDKEVLFENSDPTVLIGTPHHFT